MKKQKNRSSLFLNCFFITVITLIYWIWMLYTTQSATTSNTYKQNEIISNIEISLAHHRGSDKLYLFTQENVYMLDTQWQNERMSNELAKQIILNEELEITVWEHISRNLISEKNSKQIVGLRNGEMVYWDILAHNKHQNSQRVVGVCAGVIFSILVLLFDALLLIRQGTVPCLKAHNKNTGKHNHRTVP